MEHGIGGDLIFFDMLVVTSSICISHSQWWRMDGWVETLKDTVVILNERD